MSTFSALQIFPTAGFDRSTTTPVLLGVLISWFFTETFGWVFAGLVVPGYLAAVFVLDPRAGMIDAGEAIATYAVARALGEHLSRTGLTSRVFGRERFLLLVLSSILVRLCVEGVLLPRFAPHAAQSFFSIGLVVVPLAANACWKLGLARGLVQNGVPTLIVYALLRFVLVPYTNLSLAGFELATEDVARSFLASPKAYILLITGAVVAAAANVRDGWDFNGILIPALLALVVLEPTKLLATFVEALVLVAAVALLLRTTPLRRANIEGPRRLVLFFGVDYALRFAFAALAGRWVEAVHGGDVVAFMGFGYLLPTLIAVKIAQRGSATMVLLPTAHVAVTGFVLGTLIGFSATLLDASTPQARAAVARTMPPPPDDTVVAALWTAALARPAPRGDRSVAPTPARELTRVVDAALTDGPTPSPRMARPSRPNDPLEARWLDGSVLLVRERFEALDERFGEPAVLTTRTGRAAATRIVAWVPTPLATPEAAIFAARALLDGRVDAVVIAGIEDEATQASPFAHASRDAARALADRGPAAGDRGFVVALRRGQAAGAPRLALSERARGSLRMHALFQAHGSDTSTPPPQALAAWPAPAEQEGVDAVMTISVHDADVEPTARRTATRSLASPAALAAATAETRSQRAAPSPEDLLALRRLVLEPLLEPHAAERMRGSLAIARMASAALGLELHGPCAIAGLGRGFALLPAPEEGAAFAMLVRVEGARGTLIEIPHAHRDGLREVGLRALAVLDADAMLLGLDSGARLRGDEAFRSAHFVATHAMAGRAPRVLLVRASPADEAAELAPSPRASAAALPPPSVAAAAPPFAALGSWGGAGRADFAVDVRRGLVALGLDVHDGALDLPAREIAGRALFGEVPFVTATISPAATRALSLDEARAIATSLWASGLASFDAEPVEVARALAATIPERASPAPGDFTTLGLAATREGSVRARRGLVAATVGTSARAAVARTSRGDFLVLVSRGHTALESGRAIDVDALPLDPRMRRRIGDRTFVARLSDCAAPLASTGSCRAESP
jgi:hypothetical protein